MRIIISRAEVEALAPGSVVLNTSGTVRIRLDDGWWQSTSYGASVNSAVVADGRPVLVLYDADNPVLSFMDLLADVRAMRDQTLENITPELLAAYDFAVCWDRHHPIEEGLLR